MPDFSKIAARNKQILAAIAADPSRANVQQLARKHGLSFYYLCNLARANGTPVKLRPRKPRSKPEE